MDLIDRKLIYELDKNSRISFVKLARLLRMSPERLRYRFMSLREKGVIKHFITLMNSVSLGYSTYELFIKLQNVNHSIKGDIIAELTRSNRVAWIGDLEGNFDLEIIFLVENQLELYELVSEIYKKYSRYIMKKSLAINLEGDFLQRDYLISKDRKDATTHSYKRSKSIIKIDSVDREICKMMGKDSRITALDISKKIGISVDTVIKRLKALERGVITGYTIALDNNKVGQMHYKILLYLNNKTDEEKLISYCKFNNRVISIVKTLAEWDYEIDLEVEGIEQFKKFTMDITSLYSDMIRDYDILRIVDMPKYNFYP